MTIIAAADGSSLGNPGPMGWAWYIDDANWQAGGAVSGTNNIGELTAVLRLLQATRSQHEPLRILTDSQYVINAMTKWIYGWKRKNWKKADGKPVLNAELIQEIDREMSGRKVEFEWVRGHAGHALNEAADTRARACATAYRDGAEPDAGPGIIGAGPALESDEKNRGDDMTPDPVQDPMDLFADIDSAPIPQRDSGPRTEHPFAAPSSNEVKQMDADRAAQSVDESAPSPVAPPTMVRRHTTSSYRHRGVNVTEHRLEVPLDYANPEGQSITVFARELSTGPNDPCDEKPALIFMQGGPGGRAPRPGNFTEGWIGRALKTHRVILMDERGTGQSTRLDALTLSEFDTTAKQVEYVKHFRADSIVRDAESLRERINDGKPWVSLGQSYGGFINLTYLSHYPEALSQVYFTGGLPGLVSIDEIYRRTYEATALRNRAYFDRFPDDEKTLRAIIKHLDNHEETLPSGERLSSRRFRMIGLMLGTTTGFDQMHYFFEGPFTLVQGQTRLNTQFLDMVHRQVSMGDSPMYGLLHETIYAGTTRELAGTPTSWGAARLLDEVGHGIDEGFAVDPDPDDRETPIYLTGEHIYPWLFDEDPALVPLKDLAHALAQETDWPTLYDESVLADNRIPAAAAVYAEDMFVPLDLSLATARLAHVTPWITNEHQHDGLRTAGAEVLSKLIELATH